MNYYAKNIQAGFYLFLILLLSACSPLKQNSFYHATNEKSKDAGEKKQLPALPDYPTEQFTKLQPHYAAITHGRLEYYRFGQGSPILLIPGYVTDISSWDRQFLATLATHHQVIVLNNRNVGGSYVLSSHYESQDLAKDTYQLIETLRLKKPAVLGISMGGMIAQQLTIMYPKRIGQLILINTAIAGKKAIHPKAEIEQALLDMPQNKLGRYLIAVKLFFPKSWKMRMAVALATQRFQPSNYSEINPINVMPQQKQLVMHWVHNNDAAEKLSQLHLPVLVLNGEADVVIPPINSIILAHSIPGAKLLRWKEGGHAMIYQYPQQLAKSINEFIAEHG